MIEEPMGDLSHAELSARAQRLCEVLFEGVARVAPIDAVKIMGVFACTVAQAVARKTAAIGDPMSPERVLQTAHDYARLLLSETSADRRVRPRGQA